MATSRRTHRGLSRLGLVAAVAVISILAIAVSAFLTGNAFWTGNSGCGLSQIASIPLPGITGRVDHMAYVPSLHRLYVAALGNNSLEVVNTSSGSVDQTVGGFSEPQGVLYVPTTNSLFVSNGGTGEVNVLDATSLDHRANISFASDADNLRFDSASDVVYVGYGNGGIAAVNASNYTIQGTVTLSGHPEGFQVAPSSKSVFVNVPTSGYVAAASLADYSVVARWPLTGSSGNFPMAIDEVNGRLFVGTRSPSQLVVLDASTGTQVASIGVPQDPDDVFFNPASGCIYISSGAGYVTTVKESDPSHFSLMREVPTLPGARTSLLVPDQQLYFVAAPASGSSSAQVLVFKVL